MLQWFLNFFVYLPIVLLTAVLPPAGIAALLFFHFITRRWPFK